MESSSFNQGLTVAGKSGSKRLQDLATETKRTNVNVCLQGKRRQRRSHNQNRFFSSLEVFESFPLEIYKRFSYFKYTISEVAYVRRKEGACIWRKIEDNVCRVKEGRIPRVRKGLISGGKLGGEVYQGKERGRISGKRKGRCIRESEGDVYQG